MRWTAALSGDPAVPDRSRRHRCRGVVVDPDADMVQPRGATGSAAPPTSPATTPSRRPAGPAPNGPAAPAARPRRAADTSTSRLTTQPFRAYDRGPLDRQSASDQGCWPMSRWWLPQGRCCCWLARSTGAGSALANGGCRRLRGQGRRAATTLTSGGVQGEPRAQIQPEQQAKDDREHPAPGWCGAGSGRPETHQRPAGPAKPPQRPPHQQAAAGSGSVGGQHGTPAGTARR